MFFILYFVFVSLRSLSGIFLEFEQQQAAMPTASRGAAGL
jgi:hypothetical protein